MAGAAKRYARAIFEIASQPNGPKGGVGEWGQRLTVIREALTVPEMRELLTNPSIAVRRRQETVAAVLEERAGQEGVNLAKLLVEAGRAGDIESIVVEYERLVDDAAGRVRVTATTAIELPEADRDRLVRELAKRLNREVSLTTAVDPSIMGGLVLRIDDQLVDASVATRLRQLRKQLAGT